MKRIEGELNHCKQRTGPSEPTRNCAYKLSNSGPSRHSSSYRLKL